MKLVPMRFKGYQWRHNPCEIKFECEKTVKELVSPYETGFVQNLGRKNRLISGRGELCGEDCREQFEALWKLFNQGGTGVLAIDCIEPIYAVFESLSVIGEPKPDILTYGFVFREDMDAVKKLVPSVHICSEGDCLWDVSYLYDIPIGSLVELNRDIKRPDEMQHKGTVIYLC